MKAIVNLHYLALIALIGALTACGGGGSSGTGGGTQAPNPPTIRIAANVTSLPANPLGLIPSLDEPTTIQINVIVRTDTNTAVPDGTIVNMTTANAALGTLSVGDDPMTTGVNEFIGAFLNVNAPTVGGQAAFFFTSGSQTGSTTVTAGATDPATGTGLSAFATITVTQAVGPEDRITLTTTDTTLPLNPFGVAPFLGSPFLSEVGIQFVGSDGELVNPAGDSFAVGIAPATVAAFSSGDDPETDDINEFTNLLINGGVGAAGGQTSVFVSAGNVPGIATLTIQATDPVTGENFSNSVTFTVSEGAANGVPASITLPIPSSAVTPVFVQNIGGNTLLNTNVLLFDAGNLPVNDPADTGTFNNVLVELAPPNANGSTLSGTSGAGTPVNGSTISVATVNGVANIAFTSGTTPGAHVITVTGDSADNNVDNGIQSPVSNIGTILVGDGVLASLTLVSDLFAGPVEVSDAVTPGPTPGTLMLPIGVIANDQFGAPVLPGTPITFGKVDEPIGNSVPTTFVFSGFNGNPAEGGTFFSVPVGPGDGFLENPNVIDEAVGPGDTLVTFGAEIPGNNELESMRVVANTITNTSLSVSTAFNNNDLSSVIVDDGPVIPYVIGRSETGNIGSTAVTDATGLATVLLTYPNNVIGLPLVIWTQGTRPDGDETQTVSDAASLAFPGLGPALLSISPSSIQANSTGTIELCLTDANGANVANAAITFFTNANFTFTASNTPLTTGFDGCVTTTVSSSGVMVFDDTASVTFTGAGASTDLLLTDPMLAELTVSPSALALPMMGDSGMATVVVSGANGDPAGGAVIAANCTADITINAGMAVAGADGSAAFTVTVDDDDVVGSCSFTTTVDGQFVGDTLGINAPGGGGVGVSP